MDKNHLRIITQLRHELHCHPELSMNEIETSRIIKQFLRKYTHFQIAERGNWFYAVKEGRNPSQKIAFRADMDALPIREDAGLPYHSVNEGVSHKCGHDGHCAALCGLAMELDREDLAPSVYLIFQPGEETGQGAAICKELIRQEGISEIFAYHNLSGYPEKSIVYRRGLTQPASEGLRLVFRGKTSHASAPEDGSNPADVIAKVMLYAEETVRQRTGRQNADEKSMDGQSVDRKGPDGQSTGGLLLCTVTGVRLGSGDFGISPGEGELCLTLRAENEKNMKDLETEILACAGKLCIEAGIHLQNSLHDAFPETRNHEESLEKILQAAGDLQLQVIPMEKLWRASEDFGWYLKECHGAIVYVGNGEGHPALHTEEYDFKDSILETAVDLFCRLAKAGTGGREREPSPVPEEHFAKNRTEN